MCLGMNPDKVPECMLCASTFNRNFIGRQGKNARMYLCSPAMAALAALNGTFVDVRTLTRRKSLIESFTVYKGKTVFFMLDTIDTVQLIPKA